MAVTRSTGVPIELGGMPSGYRAGGGYSGFTDELDAIVVEAARWLEQWSGMDVTIRFNSDRKSGGAWLLTDPNDGVWKNAELGVGGGINDREWKDEDAHPTPVEPTLYVTAMIKPVCLREPDGFDAERGAWLACDTLAEAFAFVEANATTERVR